MFRGTCILPLTVPVLENPLCSTEFQMNCSLWPRWLKVTSFDMNHQSIVRQHSQASMKAPLSTFPWLGIPSLGPVTCYAVLCLISSCEFYLTVFPGIMGLLMPQLPQGKLPFHVAGILTPPSPRVAQIVRGGEGAWPHYLCSGIKQDDSISLHKSSLSPKYCSRELHFPL